MPAPDEFQYAVLRVVPAVERGERLNAGVALFCRTRGYLRVRVALDEARLRALAPGTDVPAVRGHLAALVRAADGDPAAGPVGALSQSERFGWLTAPSSTVVQPSEVHTGLHAGDLEALLDRLVAELVDPPLPVAVVFDLDGVLLDSEGAWDAARRAVVEEAGGAWRDGATEAMMGMSAPEWSRYLHEELGAALEPAEIDRRVVARVLDGYAEGLPLLPGAVQAVARLGDRWPLGMASSSNREVLDRVLGDDGALGGRFAAVVSSEEVASGKPAPDVYLEASRRLGVPPARCVAVEDSTNGIRSAALAGMGVIAVPRPEHPPTPDAMAFTDLVLDDLGALDAEAVRTAAARSAPSGRP